MKAQEPVSERLGNVDLRLIRVFCAVVQCGGMSAAEVELNIGRSTISRHVKELESRLQTCLCHRGRGGFALTPEGEHIYASALRLLAAMDQFQAEVSDAHRRMTGQLAIALFDKTVTNPSAHIHIAVADFHTQAPDVSISLHVVPVNEIEQGVIEGRYQLGISPTSPISASLQYLPLFSEQMYLYCGEAHPLFDRSHDRGSPVSDRQVRACRYAGMGFHSPNMEVGRQLGLTRSANAYDQEAIVTLIRSGRFIGFLPDHYASAFVDRGQIQRLGGDSYQYQCDFTAIYRRSPKPSRVLSTFLEALTQAHSSDG